MKRIIIPLFWMILMSSTCKKEDSDCHAYINIKNRSDKEVVFGISTLNSEGKCNIDGRTIAVDNTYKYYPFIGCIENSLKGTNSSMEVYVVDPEKYNNPNEYYDCDSIAIKNRILKQYTLTLDDLKQNNFTITYP